MADRRDPDPAPPARRPAAPAAAPPEADLGGPGTPRDPAQRDTESTPPRIAATGHHGHDPALAPRHHPAPLGGAVRARQDRPTGHPPEHRGPGPPAGPGEPRLGLPPDPRRDGRPGSQGRGVDRMGDPQDQRHGPRVQRLPYESAVIWKCGSRSIQQTPDEPTPVPAQGSSATTARVGTVPCGVAL